MLLTRCRVATPVSLVAEGPQTFSQSFLISAGLVYLSIPNILFLWGWFTPPVSLTLTALLAAAVARAAWVSFAAGAGKERISAKRAGLFVAGLIVTLLISFLGIFDSGMLGFVPSDGDHTLLRNAMFANLRDAAWPLILPNGKEMTYYLADILPPALLSRLAPHCSQWFVALWMLLAVLLSLLLVSSRLNFCRSSWGVRLIIVSVAMGLVCSPVISQRLLRATCYYAEEFAELSLWQWLPQKVAVFNNCLSSCATCYNSAPPVLLAAAMLVVCRRREEVVLPIALTLLVPLNPLGGIALLPLAVVRWWGSVRLRALPWFRLLPDALLPLLMAAAVFVYFVRADGSTHATLSGIAYGWDLFLFNYLWLLFGLGVVVFPLFPLIWKDLFFRVLVACCLLMPWLFIGSLPEPGRGLNNELWLKCAPAYVFLMACYWVVAWKHIGWYRYCYWGMCLCLMGLRLETLVEEWGTNQYLQVDDLWNGHLNHEARFLNQSIPPSREPCLPGILFREAGASEHFFPGNLLPKAPGCDYSVPPDEDERCHLYESDL